MVLVPIPGCKAGVWIAQDQDAVCIGDYIINDGTHYGNVTYQSEKARKVQAKGISVIRAKLCENWIRHFHSSNKFHNCLDDDTESLQELCVLLKHQHYYCRDI